MEEDIIIGTVDLTSNIALVVKNDEYEIFKGGPQYGLNREYLFELHPSSDLPFTLKITSGAFFTAVLWGDENDICRQTGLLYQSWGISGFCYIGIMFVLVAMNSEKLTTLATVSFLLHTVVSL
eukprot:UN30499